MTIDAILSISCGPPCWLPCLPPTICFYEPIEDHVVNGRLEVVSYGVGHEREEHHAFIVINGCIFLNGNRENGGLDIWTEPEDTVSLIYIEQSLFVYFLDCERMSVITPLQ